MIGRIRTDINRGSNFDARIKQAIMDALVYYKYRRMGWNIKRARAVLQPGSEVVSLPTDWIEADFLRLERNDERDPLAEVTYDWMEEKQRSTNTLGRPRRYAVQHRELRLYPVPDQTYTLVLSFQYELKDVSISASDGQSNAWLDEAEALIRQHAQADVLRLHIKGEEARVSAETLYGFCQDLANRLEAAAAREQSSGKIKPWL